MHFWSFIGIGKLRTLLPPTPSVFPPRTIQKARPPTGPSLRLVPCCTTRGSVLSKHLITLGGSTSF